MDVYSLEMNTIITVFVAALVFLLPLADRWICRRLRLNLAGMAGVLLPRLHRRL